MDKLLKHLKEAWKQLDEYIEPTYPKGVKSSIFKKRGVQGSVIPIKQYKFTTSKGNDVKVHFKVTEEDGGITKNADIVFYVNDTLDDSSSQKGGSATDSEILSGVLGIISKVSDRLNFDTMTFEAWSGEGDVKTIKGLDFSKMKDDLLNRLKKFLSNVKNTEPKILEPTERMRELAAQFGRDPVYRPEFDKEKLITIITKAINFIKEENPFIEGILRYIENEYTGEVGSVVFKIFPEFTEIHEMLKKAEKIILSNTKEGYKQKRNRREAIYTKLINRYFADKWEISKYYDKFTMVRKNNYG